jgi:hypothetical protein
MFIIEWMFDKIGYEKKTSFAWTFPAPKAPVKKTVKKTAKKPARKKLNG